VRERDDRTFATAQGGVDAMSRVALDPREDRLVAHDGEVERVVPEPPVELERLAGRGGHERVVDASSEHLRLVRRDEPVTKQVRREPRSSALFVFD
jgi:hypothetical protein